MNRPIAIWAELAVQNVCNAFVANAAARSHDFRHVRPDSANDSSHHDGLNTMAIIRMDASVTPVFDRPTVWFYRRSAAETADARIIVGVKR